MNIIEKKISALVVLGLAAFFSLALVSTTQAGALTNASLTPTTFYGGRTASYDVSFTVASSTEVEAQIHLVFPSGYTLPGSVATSSVTASLTSANGVVASATVTTDSIVLWLADGAVAVANDTLNFAGIPNIKNPYTGGAKTIDVRTRTKDGDESDSASATAVTIISAPTELPKQTSKTSVAAPSSKITSPAAGQVITAGQNYVIKGTSSDVGVYDVSKIEVSVDGGSTWVQASLTKVSNSNYTWEYTWANPSAGSYTIKSRATDTAGNAESPGLGVSVTVSAAAAATPTKPASEMTASELQSTITQLQQQLIGLLQKLLQLLTQQAQGY